MSSPAPDRSELLELWRQRLQDAKLRLEFAQNYAKEVQRDFPLSENLSPDGNFARAQAIRAERLAFRKYRSVLQIFSDLLLSGKIPEEAEWRREPSDDETEGEP